MSTVEREQTLVVAVGSSGQLSSGTVEFAVDYAKNLGLSVVVVHVGALMPTAAGAWYDATAAHALSVQAQTALSRAERQVRDSAPPEVKVTGQLLFGGATGALLDVSKHTQMLVLEHDPESGVGPFRLGSVTAGVAARAHAPVVSVPVGWHPKHLKLPITVGVEDSTRATAEIWTALGLAAATDNAVVVLRAAYLAAAFQELMRHEENHQDFLEGAERDLLADAALPASLGEKIPVTYQVRWGRPGDVLVEESQRSSLLVLGRRDPMLPVGSHLGPVIHQVLREASCPVMMVEPRLEAPASIAEA